MYILVFGPEVEVHSTWILWTRRPLRMQGQLSLLSWAGHAAFLGRVHKVSLGLPEGCGKGSYPIREPLSLGVL